VIRGAVYAVDFGNAKRGSEQRGRRYGIVISPTEFPLSTVAVAPTSTRAQESLYRPRVNFDGRDTLVLTDQIRAIDGQYVGELVGNLTRDEMAEVEHALSHYLGIIPDPSKV
jgi:mRNA interferase MazF